MMACTCNPRTPEAEAKESYLQNKNVSKSQNKKGAHKISLGGQEAHGSQEEGEPCQPPTLSEAAFWAQER